MATTTVSSKGLYHRCHKRIAYGKGVCAMKKHLRADLVEPLVWQGLSEILAEPERLRAASRKSSRASRKSRFWITKERHTSGEKSSPRSGARGPTFRSSPPMGL